jgi:DNA-binding NtrC family response regulator
MMQPEILLVDDERDILELGMLTLREAGYTVQSAISGDIAMVLIEEGLHFDLLITDIVMPGQLDGFALARKVKEYVPQAGIVYATGYSRAFHMRTQGVPEGQLLLKPWRLDELLAVVDAAMSPAH